MPRHYTGQYLVRWKRNQKRTRKRKWETEPSIYATLAWARVYVCMYTLSSPSICPLCLYVRVIFYVCLSLYFFDIWRFLYLPTYSRETNMSIKSLYVQYITQLNMINKNYSKTSWINFMLMHRGIRKL